MISIAGILRIPGDATLTTHAACLIGRQSIQITRNSARHPGSILFVRLCARLNIEVGHARCHIKRETSNTASIARPFQLYSR